MPIGAAWVGRWGCPGSLVCKGGWHGDGFGGASHWQGHWTLVSLRCVWWLHTLSQGEQVANPVQASVSLFVVCTWVPSLLGDGSQHGLVLEDLGSNPESSTLYLWVCWQVSLLHASVSPSVK